MKKLTLTLLLAIISFPLLPQGAGIDAPSAETGKEEPKKESAWQKFKNYFLDTTGSTRHLEPYRMNTLKTPFSSFRAGAGSDSTLGFFDIFSTNGNIPGKKSNNMLIIDMDAMNGSDLNFFFDLDIGSDGALLFGFEKYYQLEDTLDNPKFWGWGFGLGALSARFDINFSKELVSMISGGIKKGETEESYLQVGAGVFAETLSLNYNRDNFIIPRLYASFSLSHFFPVLYIPSGSKVNVDVTNTEERVEAKVNGAVKAYSAIDFSSGAADLGMGGLDFDVNAEYQLFSIMDVGVTGRHIPLVPTAKLKHSITYDISGTLFEGDSFLNAEFPMDISIDSESETSANLTVLRPMRWDFYLNYRPARSDFVVITPTVGFTVLTFWNTKASFNAGAGVDLNLGRAFTFGFWTGQYDGLAHNKLSFAFHLKRFGCFLILEGVSNDYIRAWEVKGASVSFGGVFGW